jgi:alpha-ketoglutarate-dependent taurine dioxygenase
MLIPENCIFTAENGFEIEQYRRALIDTGIALICLKDLADRDGTLMKTMIEQLGVAGIHDRNGTCVWDVRYDDSVDQEKGTRSLTTKEFPLHTDGSFEDPPPGFVALYCVNDDQLGGGETLFVECHKILSLLSKTSRRVLEEHDFELKIPNEFYKGKDRTKARLLSANGCFRFRKDILVLDELAPSVVRAVEELDQLINSPEQAAGIKLRPGEIVVFDNGRFFHGRKKIEDKNRHLKRMWFHLNPRKAD